MERNLVIKLGMDRKPAEAASRQFHAAEQSRIKELLTDVQVAEQAKTQVIDRENARRVAAAVGLADANRGGDARSLSSAEVVSAAKVRIAESENARRVALMVRAFQSEQDRLARSLSATEVAERAKSARIEGENARRVADAVRAMQPESERIARSLSETEAAERAKSQVVEAANREQVAAIARSLMTEEQRIGRALTETEAAERAKAAMVERSNRAKVDALVKASMSEEERIGHVLSAEDAAEKAKVALVERANRAKVDAAVRASLTEDQLLTKALTKEQAAFQARDAIVRRHNQTRVDAAIKAMDTDVKGWLAATFSIEGASKAAGSFVLQMAGLNSVQAVLGTIIENFEAAKRSAFDATKVVGEYRAALLELAALKGNLGQTTQALKEEIVFRGKTLQTSEQSRAFQETALGVGESAVDNANFKRKISRSEFNKAMELGGAFQSSEGGDARAHGALVGLIPTLSKERMTGENVFTKERQLFKIFQPGGATFSSLATQYAKLAPQINSGLYKDTEAAALLSAFSTTNKEGAGENVQQFTRATLGGIGKKGMPRVEGAEAQGKYFREGLGITDDVVKHTEGTKLPFMIADRISADLVKQEGASKAKGEEFNPYVYMRQKGFMNQEDIGAMLQYHALKQSGAMDQTFMPLAADAARPTAKQSAAEIEATRTDPMWAHRKGQIADEAANIAAGSGKEEMIHAAKRLAFDRLKAKGEVFGNYESDYVQQSDWSPKQLIYGYKQKVNVEAQRVAEEEAKKHGIDFDDPSASYSQVDMYGGAGGPKKKRGRDMSIYGGDERLYGILSETQKRGGDTTAGFAPIIGAAEKSLAASQAQERAAVALGQAVEKLDKVLNPPARPVDGRPRVQQR